MMTKLRPAKCLFNLNLVLINVKVWTKTYKIVSMIARQRQQIRIDIVAFGSHFGSPLIGGGDKLNNEKIRTKPALNTVANRLL
jgi:hypothetical protein